MAAKKNTSRNVNIGVNNQSTMTVLANSPLFHLSLSSKELFHSNFLAWLGNNANTKGFFADVINLLVQGINLTRAGSWVVEREDKHFDLCIKDGNQYLLVIENKVKSIPDKTQLDKYFGKVSKVNCKFMLLTLVDKFPNMNNTLRWEIKTYSDLATAMSNNLGKSSLGTYENSLIKDYISFISELNKLQSSLQTQSTFVPVCPKGFVRLSDLCEKIRFSGYAMELQAKIANISKDIIVYDGSTQDLHIKNADSNKLYIKVGWGYTNKQGLVDIAIPVTDLTSPKIKYGDCNPNHVVKIQVQGDNYSHVIETFIDSPVNSDLINIGRSAEYTGKRQFFTVDPLDSKLPLPNFGNSSIFEPKVYPINKNRIKGNWPFASYKSKGEITFIYQSMIIKQSESASSVIDNIVDEVKKILRIFK
jgi:hypothetical protein